MDKSDILNQIFTTLESRHSITHLINLFGERMTNNFIDWLYDFRTIKKLDFTNFPVEIYVAENKILGMIEDMFTWYMLQCYNIKDVNDYFNTFQ